MQTKNVNVDYILVQEENKVKGYTVKKIGSMVDESAPPLPPRSTIFVISNAVQNYVKGEGNGPYKPVPPPKPLQQQNVDCFTPPPYRMPPYPLYNEPIIPGAASLDTSSPISTPDTLQTHSNKFPIEKEVILSSTDKNSKIPILHEYMKKSKGAVAPDLPPKQMAAWTQAQSSNIQQQRSNSEQSHSLYSHQQQPQNNSHQLPESSNNLYRASYHHDYYGHLQSVSSSPSRAQWQGDISRHVSVSRIQEESNSSTETKDSSKNNLQKETTGNKTNNNKTVSKTYNTIKDLISSKFKSGKEYEERNNDPESGLNNATVDDSSKCRNHDGLDISEERQHQMQMGSNDQSGYGRLPHNFTQQMHQHILTQKPQQSRQAVPQSQVSQHQYYMHQQQQKCQEIQEQLYIPSSYIITSQRPVTRYGISQANDQHYVMIHSSQHAETNETLVNEGCVERSINTSMEKRSAQQIERDNLRQRTFESRRAASQPQLAYEDKIEAEERIRNNPVQLPIRHNSHGNITETSTPILGTSNHHVEESLVAKKIDQDGNAQKRDKDDSSKMCEALVGTPRKRLECEIGKIEGVYNIKSSSDKEEVKGKKQIAESAASSDYDKSGQASSNVDSGRGSAAYSSGRRPNKIESNNESSYNSRNDSEWVDVVENELRTILEPKLHELSLHGNVFIANSTVSESMSSMSPPLPPISPEDQSSPSITPRNSTKYKKHHSLPYGSKPEYDHEVYNKIIKGPTNGANSSRWQGNSGQKQRAVKKADHSAYMKGKQMFGLDNTDVGSTTTRSLDMESVLDNQSDSEGDLSTTDARAIRKQLEGLESMYSEVLKILGVKKQMGRYQPSDPRFSKRRYGSMSSLPSSSVSSRPIRDKRRMHDDRRKVKDIRGVNKRFQRLESHVVTLARSVAHLSSEMRTQHLMIQEMENIRGEIAALRAQTNMLNIRSQSVHRGSSNSKDLPNLTNPTRVKKLTKFFGDEPPLLRLFLRKLGYEKYANVFENERVGMVELPYLSEERLQKMGVPLGPRLRILQEAQISVCKENTLAIV